jgi:ABC-2 type transport system ATP-binding protein
VELAVKIKNLTIVLGGRFKALKNVSIDLPAGKMVGVIGPSGAGKTTLIRGIVGRQHITTGTIIVFDQPAGSPLLRKQMSYMTQELSVYPDLTVRENLRYFAIMAGQLRKHVNATIIKVLEAVDLTDKATNLVSSLSGGEKQRVSLAIALIGSPKLLVLDEPTVGLDPVLRENLWNLFARLADQGHSLIITSHSMEEAERCDDLVLIRNGRIIAHSSPQELRVRTGTSTVEQSFLKLVGDKHEH